MSAKQKPKPSNKEKEIHKLFNSGWSNVSLGHIRTWDKLLEYIGAPSDSIGADKLSQLPDYPTYKIITQRILESLVGPKIVQTSDPTEVSILRVHEALFKDSLIESVGYTGQEFPLIHVSRPVKISIHELVEPYWPKDNISKAKCYPFQEEEAKWMFYKQTQEGHRARLLRVNTGDGKTYCLGRYLRALIDSGYLKNKTYSPYPILYVTKASVVEQTERVLENEFGLDLKRGQVFVTNYDALRASLGEIWIEEEEIVESGVAYTKFKWKPLIHPLDTIWDEAQALKNTGSKQSRIGQAFSDIPEDWPNAKYTFQIFSSATPFAKVSSAKCFCVATHNKFQLGDTGIKRVLNNNTWPAFEQQVAYPAEPFEYNKAAIKRLLVVMSPYVGGFKNVRRKHKGYTKAIIVNFETIEKQTQYNMALEKYLEEKARIEGDDSIKNKEIMILVALQVFQQAAELIKADMLAANMYKDVSSGKFATAGAFKFKSTIAKIVILLNEKYGVSRERISLIWGGSAELSDSEKYSMDEIKNILTRAALDPDGFGVENKKHIRAIHKQLKMANLGLGDLPKNLDMGIQSRKARQREIDNFQRGITEYCLFTFGAGGAGLSLHHTDKHDGEPVITKQRRGNFAVTWNEMDMAQANGRLPRLTSLSDTEQLIWAYAGTIEVAVLKKLNMKTSCLVEVINHSDIVESSAKEDREAEDILRIQSGQKAIEDESDDEEDDDDLGREAFEEFEEESVKQDASQLTIDV